MIALWAVTPEKLNAAIQRLVRVAQPSRIILFGSAARGEADDASDVDLLVVLPEEPESMREVELSIRRAVDGIEMSKDILLVSEERLAEVGDRPSLVYREALREGKMVYEAPTVSSRSVGGTKPDSSDVGLPHWWLRDSRKALAFARLIYERHPDFAGQVCFHCQQAAEKAVKAVLLERDVDFPYTHDLGKLVGEVTKRGPAVPPDVARAKALTDYAVKTRYPNTEHEITDENVADAVRIADAVVAWASTMVRDPHGA